MKREGAKPKGQYMKDATDLKKYIMEKVPSEKFNFIAMSKPVSTLLKEANGDLNGAKKAFNKDSFLKEYKQSLKSMQDKKDSKKANKA